MPIVLTKYFLFHFHSSSRDKRRQAQLARSLQLVKTRRPTGRYGHWHYHLYSYRDHQRPCCHFRHLRPRPRGASHLHHLRSHHLLTSLPARRGLGNGHACQARSTHILTPLIIHNNCAQADRAPKVPPLPHTPPFRLRLLRRGRARQTGRHAQQSFRTGRSLRSSNHIDIVSRAGLISRHAHIIVRRVTRCVSVLFI